MVGAVSCMHGRGIAAPVQIPADVAPAGLADCGVIEIEFASGARMQITGAVDPAMLTATVTALADGRACDDPNFVGGPCVDCDGPH
jgi:hypothetical protein